MKCILKMLSILNKSRDQKKVPYRMQAADGKFSCRYAHYILYIVEMTFDVVHMNFL